MARIVPEVWNIPARLREKVGPRAGRQRLMTHEGHVLLLLHQVPRDADPDRHAVVFWRDVEGEWRCAPGRDDIVTLQTHVESYAKYVDELEEQLAKACRAEDYLAVVRAARPVQRAARHMYQALAQLRETLPEDDRVLPIRDLAYEVERAVELLVEEAEGEMQFMVAKRAEEQARLSERISVQTHRLNMIAALFLPITALGAILGMNLENGLEHLPEPVTFWSIVAGAFLVGFLIRAQVARERG
ncbi:CorA family divalent cation transporter [Sandaracinus amylolyticus]|uniref:Magnesium and cobalt transport protein CorA n=1 Tax=Sandaracinus amylolyticus TaxID=927083 RepID=A0A0F6W1J9_9BACT|nr:CorA family divalent cation transporter [Sandaracinus amylolyticus]AKF04890.1 hypothetical protein DB32_002039 [Sandaracinus amylolyticus]